MLIAEVDTLKISNGGSHGVASIPSQMEDHMELLLYHDFKPESLLTTKSGFKVQR